jgi:hypothetical protein
VPGRTEGWIAGTIVEHFVGVRYVFRLDNLLCGQLGRENSRMAVRNIVGAWIDGHEVANQNPDDQSHMNVP